MPVHVFVDENKSRGLLVAAAHIPAGDVAVLVPKEDPLLWVPDAIAWSWMRGGHWRQAVTAFCQLHEV